MIVPVPLLILALILFVLLVVNAGLKGSYLNLLANRQGEFQAWAVKVDPDYWGERLGREASGPLVNEEPEPPGPPECVGVHPVAADGRTCSDCGMVLVAR